MSIDTDFSTILDAYERQLRCSALPWNRWEAVRDSGTFALTVPEDSDHPLLQHGHGYIALAGLSSTFREYYTQILCPIDKANREGQRLHAGEYQLLLDDFQLYFLQTTGRDAKAAANAVKARLEATYSPFLDGLGFTSSRDPGRSRTREGDVSLTVSRRARRHGRTTATESDGLPTRRAGENRGGPTVGLCGLPVYAIGL